MTLDVLLKLTEEFSHIYKTHGESLNIKKYAMRSSLRETPQNPNQQQQQQQQQRPGQNQVAPSIATLPPPPVAPQLNPAVAMKAVEPARRIDLNDYKLRNSAAQQQQSSGSQNPAVQAQRRNFMRPDVPPQTVSKGLDLPLPPIIANEKQQNQSKPEQIVARSSETSKAPQASKSGTPKLISASKPTTNAVKTSQPLRPPITSGEQERHKRPRPDDYEKEVKHRRIDKTGMEGSHHRKRPRENSQSASQLDSGPATTTTTATPAIVSQMPKSGTSKPPERYNSTALTNHTASGTSSTASRPREEIPVQPSKRDTSSGSGTKSRDDSTALKKPRQTAPLNALLPTPPSNVVGSAVGGSSQNSKYNASAVQLNRTTNYVGESAHRTNASNWSMTGDYYNSSVSSNAVRFSQPSGSSSHRHYQSSNAGRTKAREPLLCTPDAGNSSYYRRSRPRPPSPIGTATSNTSRQSQRPTSPGSRSGSSYSSSSTRMLSALPPPPPPPPNEELEDGEVL